MISGTITTPWRVILIGKDLNSLVTSDVLHNLCPPPDPRIFPQGFATDWLRPGRAVWKYLDGGGQSNLETMKDFSKWAGELGFEHNVIEGFWRRFPAEDLRGLVDYARERKVGTWLWHHTNALRTPEARKEFWDQCNKAGAVGVKLDFLDHEAREVVDLYETLLREAAEHKLMVNFHGANKPTGESRTWPNEMTREAVRGMEASRLKERASHNTILPFTRFLAGHADYTPVHFGDRRGDTTAAHQIATAAIFDSSLLTYGAHPEKLLKHPAVEMIKSIPATWDETRVLPPSEIGQCAIFARRAGQTWFLAIINGPQARKVEVPLSFLARGEHVALVVSDDKADPAAVNVQQVKLRSGDAIEIDLPGGGGYLARFSSGS
jgi:alpha-glucosidase